jgi:hypothetical protein
MFGYTAYAYMWALMAKAALGKEARTISTPASWARRVLLRPAAAAYSLVECVGEGRQRVAVPAGCSAVLKVLRHVSILLHDVLHFSHRQIGSTANLLHMDVAQEAQSNNTDT